VKAFYPLFAIVGMATLWLLAAASPAQAAGVTVTVHDRDGSPVPDVAVYIEQAKWRGSKASQETRATMDQVDQRFVPHLLVVQTGTLVEFPNSDTIAHHVYSFSHPNQFKLPIYKGHAHAPVRFEESGIVVLGCNIHDNMLAYIAVVDTPVFGKTDANGTLHVDGSVQAGDRVSIWSPRLRDDEERLSVVVESDEATARFAFRLRKSLRLPHQSESEALSWSEY
jgi:plastocyanin